MSERDKQKVTLSILPWIAKKFSLISRESNGKLMETEQGSKSQGRQNTVQVGDYAEG